MSRIDKIVTGVIVAALIASASIFGIWEDKMLLDAPPILLLYLVLAAWVVGRRFAGGTAASRSAVAAAGAVTRGKWKVERDEPVDSSTSNIPHAAFYSRSIVPPGGTMLLLFWFLSAALIPFSVIPYDAKISTLRIGVYIGCYWMLFCSLQRFQQSRAVLMTLLAALIFIALYSLVQHRVAPNLIFGMERYTYSWKDGRLGGTYQCPNHIAHLFQMWLPFLFAFLFVKRLPLFWRITCAYSIPLFCLLIYQTHSRAGLLGAVAALSVTVLTLILFKSRKWFLVALVTVPLLAAGALGGLWMGSAMFRDRMQPVVQFVRHHLTGAAIESEFQDFRPLTWADSMKMIADKPFFGHGPGNYDRVFPEYRQRVKNNRMITVHAHNEYIELLAEYGIAGAVLVFLAVAGAVITLLRLALRSSHPQHAFPVAALMGALAGTAVHGFFDFELRIFPNALMLAVLAGCAAGPVVHQADQRLSRRSLSSVFRPLISIVILIAALWSLPVFISGWLRAWGDRMIGLLQPARAERLHQAAARIDPQNRDAHLGLGVVYSKYRFYEIDPALKTDWALKAFSAYSDAYLHDPKKEEIVYGLGMAHLALGNRDEGLQYLRQAARYRRFNDFYWRKLGIELRKAGLYEEALDVFNYAATLNRGHPTIKRNIQWLKERKPK